MGDRTQTGHLLSPNETSNIRIWFYVVELLTKGISLNHPKKPCCSKLLSSIHTADKALLLKTTLPQFSEHGEF